MICSDMGVRYYANFSANNGVKFATPIEGTDKSRLIRAIRAFANGERCVGSECEWWVFDERGEEVARGGTTCTGWKYRVKCSQ